MWIAATVFVFDTWISVCPSAGARRPPASPMVPLAPPRLSTTTG